MSTALIVNPHERTCLKKSSTIEGRVKAIIVSALAVTLLAGSAWSVAAEKTEPQRPPMNMHGMEGMPMGGGMGGMGEGMGGMMGMMNMMGACNRMMSGGMAGHMPQLPPGNEKLQLQMHAEMMQKMGETLAKYAAQIKEEKK